MTTALHLFLIILAAALLSNSVTVGVQLWLVARAARRETAKRPALHICEPPSFTDDELEEQIIQQQRALEGFQRLERRRGEAITRLLKRGVLEKDPREEHPFAVRAVRPAPPPNAS